MVSGNRPAIVIINISVIVITTAVPTFYDELFYVL